MIHLGKCLEDNHSLRNLEYTFLSFYLSFHSKAISLTIKKKNNLALHSILDLKRSIFHHQFQ